MMMMMRYKEGKYVSYKGVKSPEKLPWAAGVPPREKVRISEGATGSHRKPQGAEELLMQLWWGETAPVQ